MSKAVCFIDGFNLYHSLEDSTQNQLFIYRKYKWLDFKKLLSFFIQSQDQLSDIFYFTTICNWDAKKSERQKRYNYVLKGTGIKIRYGRFQPIKRTCRAVCKKEYSTHEEKRTDVAIAVNILSMALNDEYDSAYILSGDSDLIPSIEEVLRLKPEKKIYMIFPVNSFTHELAQLAVQHFSIREHHLKASQFDLEFKSHSGKTIICPEEWLSENN